jgi:CzcA family heavy metal efflux pump
MTWLVKVALERPYTFIVMALMILIFGPLAAIRTPTDIFPNIGIPVIGVAFTYAGLSPDDVSGRVMTPYERILSTTVNDVEHVESQSMSGIGIAKIFFQPNVDIRLASAQVTSISQTAIRQMPPGSLPPLIINYSASTVPVLQMAFSSASLSEQQVLDYSQNFIRPRLTTVQGAAVPYSYGGKFRAVQIDLDPAAMQARGLSATDVQNAFAAQNQIVPAGNIKIGSFQYTVRLNNAADTIAGMNDLPVKTAPGGGTVFLHDVGHVRDGNPPQGNIVHVNGNRAVLSTVLKNGQASTIDVVNGIKGLLPILKTQLPDALKIDVLSDQSLFVKAAINGVVREGAIAAGLTSMMILLFLGSWRSTVIIATSIPLAVLCALMGLWATGQTLNIMTLGGLALAVGILVDDATVTIENINWHLEQGKGVYDAIMDGAMQIATPAFVSMLCICVAFVPMFALQGVAGFLFVPMAMAVVFAMIASFLLSRTLVPTLSLYLLKPHKGGGQDVQGDHFFARLQRRFEAGFEKVREQYRNLLAMAMTRRRIFVIGFLVAVAVSMVLFPFLGEDFFPAVDSGQVTLHMRTPSGTRIEDTTQIVAQVEKEVRRVIPKNELATIVDNVGLNQSPINLIYSNSGTIGYQDADIFISLNEDRHATAGYVKTLRERLPKLFPEITFSYPPPDITSQILNFGQPAPLDLQVSGVNRDATEAFGFRLLREIKKINGLVDARMQQSTTFPQLDVKADRSRIAQLGLTERDVTNALSTSLAGTSQSAPNFWLNPKNGVSYNMTAQTPEYKLDSLAALQNLPVTGATAGIAPQVLGGVSQISRSQGASVVTHYNILPTIDLFATTQGRDLGAVANDVKKVIDANMKYLPRGATVTLRGQINTMNTAFSGLFYGLLAAVVLIYLLIVVNFQSWLDPFVIITALPAALAGIVWTLFATGTTLSVPALTGAIMCMGVATANSILVIAFARERLAVHGDAVQAAVEAGFTRFRPVLMTALAMIIGMAPMALGLGEGGEQNAPLGRAVIGGLIFATMATLMFVPVVFSIIHGRRAAASKPRGPEGKSGEAHA